MPWGPPLITWSWAPVIASAVRRPLALKGTVASASPWMTRVGTSILARSSRKSVVAKAMMQPRVPFGEGLEVRSDVS